MVPSLCQSQSRCRCVSTGKPGFELTSSSPEQHQGVVPQRVEREADHGLRSVHAASQSGGQRVRLRRHRHVVAQRGNGAVHAPGHRRFGVGVD